MSVAPMHYSALVQDLFGRLPRSGSLGPGSGQVVHGESVALDRGAWVRFEARVEDGCVTDCVFRAWGCPHTLAAAALVAARTPGRQVDADPVLDAQRLAAELEAPPAKLGRLLVVEDALVAMLERARAVQLRSPWQSS